jgi:hypothetical protein
MLYSVQVVQINKLFSLPHYTNYGTPQRKKNRKVVKIIMSEQTDNINLEGVYIH